MRRSLTFPRPEKRTTQSPYSSSGVLRLTGVGSSLCRVLAILVERHQPNLLHFSRPPTITCKFSIRFSLHFDTSAPQYVHLTKLSDLSTPGAFRSPGSSTMLRPLPRFSTSKTPRLPVFQAIKERLPTHRKSAPNPSLRSKIGHFFIFN